MICDLIVNQVKVNVLAGGFTLRITNIADLCSFDEEGFFVNTSNTVPGNIPGTITRVFFLLFFLFSL